MTPFTLPPSELSLLRPASDPNASCRPGKVSELRKLGDWTFKAPAAAGLLRAICCEQWRAFESLPLPGTKEKQVEKRRLQINPTPKPVAHPFAGLELYGFGDDYLLPIPIFVPSLRPFLPRPRRGGGCRSRVWRFGLLYSRGGLVPGSR